MKKALKLLARVMALIAASSPGMASAESANAGIVTAVAGHVSVVRLGAPPRPLKPRDILYWRDVVETRKDSTARILLAGKTTLTVRELSRLELREETLADGVRYTVELVAGKVRASVARMLMGRGEQVEVRTRNAVASVRGTDFIVETVERPTQDGAFGLLGVREIALGAAGGGFKTGETLVTTLSGVVDLSNRLAGMARVERARAYEAVRLSGRLDPARLEIQPVDVELNLMGLQPPRPE